MRLPPFGRTIANMVDAWQRPQNRGPMFAALNWDVAEFWPRFVLPPSDDPRSFRLDFCRRPGRADPLPSRTRCGALNRARTQSSRPAQSCRAGRAQGGRMNGSDSIPGRPATPWKSGSSGPQPCGTRQAPTPDPNVTAVDPDGASVSIMHGDTIKPEPIAGYGRIGSRAERCTFSRGPPAPERPGRAGDGGNHHDRGSVARRYACEGRRRTHVVRRG